MCDVHTKTAVLNALLLTPFTASASLHLQRQFEVTSSERVVFQIPKDHCQHVCQCKRSPCKQGDGEGCCGLGKKHGQYFIYMVTSGAASSFILFHAARSLELLE